MKIRLKIKLHKYEVNNEQRQSIIICRPNLFKEVLK